jgi:hypothetical protein
MKHPQLRRENVRQSAAIVIILKFWAIALGSTLRKSQLDHQINGRVMLTGPAGPARKYDTLYFMPTPTALLHRL